MFPSQPALRSNTSRSRTLRNLLSLACAVCLLPLPALAQRVLRTSAESPETAPIASAPAAPARLTGTVADNTGALIPGARVSLQLANGTPKLTISADAEGRFRFDDLAPGSYAVAVSAPGFEPSARRLRPPQPRRARELAPLSLAVPVAHADVIVSVTRHELATEELHQQEQQRVFGFPDFYTTYAANPAPLDTGQKFSLALHATTDRMSFVGAALIAGGEQVQNTFPAYGRGPQGYAKRYGAAYTDALTGKFIGSALLPSLFRQDPRYFYDGTGSYKQRATHAILAAILVRGDNGHLQPNYSHILGNAAAGALSTLYHPATDTAARLALDNALLGTLGEAGVNLTREFLLRHLTRGLAPTP